MDRFDFIELGKGKKRNSISAQPLKPPEDGPSSFRVAQRMRRAGLLEGALPYYERALGFNEHDYHWWAEYIDTLIRSGNPQKALKKADAILDTYKKVRLLYACKALAMAHCGKLANAYAHSEVTLEDDYRAWYALCVRAEIVLMADRANRGDAVELVLEAVDKVEDKWEPYYIGGRFFLRANLPTFAAGFLSEAVHVEPTAAAGWVALGDAFEALRLYDQAKFYYEKALEMIPDHEFALKGMRKCAGKSFGLLKVFNRDQLHTRWNAAFYSDSTAAMRAPDSNEV